MLIKSPMKKKKVKPNTRSKKAGKKKKSGPARSGNFRRIDNHGKRVDSKKEEKKRISMPKIKPWKVVVGAMVLGALGVVYLNHVFATQQLLREVQQLEAEYNQAMRLNNDYRLTYDRMIGPADIYEKAQDLGFINGGPAEKVIEVER